MPNSKATTVGDLRRAVERGDVPRRSVHEEVRQNLIRKLRAGETLFPGIVGYDDAGIPRPASNTASGDGSTPGMPPDPTIARISP